MIRHLSHIRVRPRRIEHPTLPAAQEPIAVVLTADQIELKAQLHEQAAQHDTRTLSRMQERTQQAARNTPELAPFLTAYFEAAGHSLLTNTLAMLDEPPVASPRLPRWHRRRFPISRVIPRRLRKDPSDGPA
jgi:hypothetical protein